MIDFTELAYAVNRVDTLANLSEARLLAVQCLIMCEHPDSRYKISTLTCWQLSINFVRLTSG